MLPGGDSEAKSLGTTGHGGISKEEGSLALLNSKHRKDVMGRGARVVARARSGRIVCVFHAGDTDWIAWAPGSA